jgi:hypothetical protein
VDENKTSAEFHVPPYDDQSHTKVESKGIIILLPAYFEDKLVIPNSSYSRMAGDSSSTGNAVPEKPRIISLMNVIFVSIND